MSDDYKLSYVYDVTIANTVYHANLSWAYAVTGNRIEHETADRSEFSRTQLKGSGLRMGCGTSKSAQKGNSVK